MQYEDGDVSPIKAFFRKKWVRFVLFIDIVAILAIIAIIIINATKVSTLTFNITPIDATISVNGDTSYQNGTFAATPGTYEITISHDGLESKAFSIDLAPRHAATISTFLPDENNNYEFYKLKENYLSLQKLIEIASEGHNTTTDHDTSAERFIKDFNRILSISDVLPVTDYIDADPSINSPTAGFTIRGLATEDACKVTACLLVNYYGNGYEETVKAKIIEAGFNPDDYQIVYERYN